MIHMPAPPNAPSPDHPRRRDDLDRTKPPPAVRTNRGRVATLIACGTILAILLVVVVLNIETGQAPAPPLEPVAEEDITELIPPALTDDDARAAGIDRGVGFELPEGGMIQVPNDDGSLAQEYRFARLEPRPEGRPAGWLEMVEPFAVIYGRNGQVLTLAGDSALAKAPNRALESGTLSGHVVIHVYDSEPGRRFVAGELEPVATVTTDEAQFDNVFGQVTCAGEVNVESTNVDLSGAGLRLQINSQLDIAQLWVIDDIRSILLRRPPTERPPTPDASGDARTAPAPGAPAPEAPAGIEKSLDEVQFYRLTLSENVRIVQDDAATGRLATGDELMLIFSFESQGLGDLMSLGPPRSDDADAAPFGVGPMSREQWLVSLAIASWQDDGLPRVGPGETLITCDGPLTMVPLDDLAERPATPADARLTISGAPGGEVVLHDLRADARARGGALVYTTENGHLQLTRSAGHPVRFESPDYTAEGEHLWIDQSTHEGGFDGEGWLASVGAGGQAAEQDAPPAADDGENPIERLRVTWTGGVHFDFAPTGQGQPLGPMTRATFTDEVEVRGDDGEIDCANLELQFRQNDADETVPAAMIATGDARLRAEQSPDAAGGMDGPQTIFADTVHVMFAEAAGPPAGAEVATDAVRSANPFGSGTEVQSLHAEGDVQVLLADGTRVFADTLDGNARQEEIILQGDNIVFVSGQTLVERGTHVRLVKADSSADWRGPGVARIFASPIDVSADRRIDRPVPANDDAANPRQVGTRWEDSMRYEGDYNDGAGRLIMVGKVEARSTPSPLEVTTMNGARLELQFADSVPAAPAADRLTMDASTGRLGRVIATGEARVESRTRYEAAPDVPPRVFYIAGEHIEYDARTLDALVDGAGDLLVRDLLPDEGDPADGGTPFSSKGTTAFKWTHRLDMTHIVDDNYEITMSGNVVGQHLGLDGSPTQVTADRLVAAVARREADPQRQEADRSLVLGAGLDLRQVTGAGGVFVHTATRDVSCDNFEYSVLTGLARIAASPGGRITIKSRGEADRFYASRIDWNMATDRIEVMRGGGSTPR